MSVLRFADPELATSVVFCDSRIGILGAEERFTYGENLGDVLVNTQDNLNMSGRILAANRNGVLCSDHRRFGENCISDRSFNLPDLLNCPLLGQAVEE